MGLEAIDPHSLKVQAKLYKIPKFGVHKPNSKQDTASKNAKIYKEMYRHPDAVRHSVRMTIHFLNFEVFKSLSVKTSLINTKLGNFVNLSVLFLTMLINCCLSHNLQART